MVDMFMDRERAFRLVRVALAESLQQEEAANAADLDAALVSLDGIDAYGNTDHDQLKDEIKARFATSIDEGTAEDGTPGYEAYVNQASEKAIDQGYAETVRTKKYRKIVIATSTLATAPDMSFEYKVEGEEEPEVVEGQEPEETAGEMVGKLIESYRETGKFRPSFIRGDRLARALGSSALYIRWREGGPIYQAVPPQSVKAAFADTVESNGESRATDNTDVDDATAIAIRLPDFQANSAAMPIPRYLVYAGRSTEYPKGRCCVYTVSTGGQWLPIPQPGSNRVLEEYMIGEEIANPLTVAQDKHGEDAVPTEYPVSILLGQEASADLGLFPTNGLALWRDTVELDIMTSRIASGAVEGARGLFVVTDTTGAPLPRSLTGAVAGREGMTIAKIGHEAAGAAKSAMETVGIIGGDIANAYSVPAYQMVHDGTKAPQSGYSLDVQNLPLEQMRNERIGLNRPAVQRIFAIERGLHYAHSDNPGAIPKEVIQHWNPGTVSKPVNRKEQIENLSMAEDKGYIDHVAAVQEYHGFATRQEAEKYIKENGLEAAAKPAQTGLRAINAPPPRPPRGQQQPEETPAEEGTE